MAQDQPVPDHWQGALRAEVWMGCSGLWRWAHAVGLARHLQDRHLWHQAQHWQHLRSDFPAHPPWADCRERPVGPVPASVDQVDYSPLSEPGLLSQGLALPQVGVWQVL